MSAATKGRRGIHTKPNNGFTNNWITPIEIVRSLGAFDLDPCRCWHQPWDTAAMMYTEFEDGLWCLWHGRVWLNPPYRSEIGQWLKRLADHGNGVALVPARTEVESWFWPFVWDAADAILFRKGRIYFHRPDGSLAGNAGHGSVIVAYGRENAEIVRNCGIYGRFFSLR